MPLTYETALPHRVPLVDPALAAQCTEPPHTCIDCWRAMRNRVPRTAVAAGDEFYRLLQKAIDIDALSELPALAPFRPLSRRAVADQLICHAHAMATHQVQFANAGNSMRFALPISVVRSHSRKQMFGN